MAEKPCNQELRTDYRLGRSAFRTFEEGLEREWLLTNGIGGFANQSVIGANTRIFSGYLVASLVPPVERYLVWGGTRESVRVWHEEEAEIASYDARTYAEQAKGRVRDTVYDLTAQEYPNEKKEGQRYLTSFTLDVLPEYCYQTEDVRIKKTVSMVYGKNQAVVCYEAETGAQRAELTCVPLLCFRPFGAVSERADLQFERTLTTKEHGGTVTLKKDGMPGQITFFASEGQFFDRSQKKTSMATPNYVLEENLVYRLDARTGFRGTDFYATPYEVTVTLAPHMTTRFYVGCAFEAEGESLPFPDGFSCLEEYKRRIYALMDLPKKQDRLTRRLAWAADAFLVERRSTGLKTVLAGFPWFADWGRDTMIAMQGLTLATGRFADAREILLSFSKYVSRGMLPNVFPNRADEAPMYNTIDASLWYFYSVERYLFYTGGEADYAFIKETIYPSLKEIYHAYKEGTRFAIHMEPDGLIAGGSDKDQLTWMDVRVGDWVVTPRHGKTVEVNALWYNALCVLALLAARFKEPALARECEALAARVKESFLREFWNEERNCLYDVVGPYGEKDASLRPNQVTAAMLPYTMLSEEKLRAVVDVVYRALYTPYGMRSLAQDEPGYQPAYTGRLFKRDGAYHMGTTWGYLSGAFFTAYRRAYGHTKEGKERLAEFFADFADQLEDGCLNGCAEIFDGDAPVTGRGCYHQAWSVGEFLRAYCEEDAAACLEDRKG